MEKKITKGRRKIKINCCSRERRIRKEESRIKKRSKRRRRNPKKPQREEIS